jgi:hypothetical protein
MNTWVLLERKDSLLPRIFQQIAAPDLALLFGTTELAAYVDQSPILVTCTDRSSLLDTVQKTPEDWLGLLIESDCSTAVLLAHLRQILFVRFDGNRRGVLRYSSPTTASYFFAACTASSLSQWLGPIRRLRWYGGTWPDQALHKSNWQECENLDAGRWEQRGLELPLDSDQQRALRAQSQDHFLYLWWCKRPEISYAQAQQWLHKGLDYGFEKPDSMQRYLMLREAYPQADHPAFLPSGSDEFRLDHLYTCVQPNHTARES